MKQTTLFAALAGLGLVGSLALFTPVPPADAAATAALASARQEARTYQVDPVHTAVIFGIEWGGMSQFYGQFTDYNGTLTYDGSDPASFQCEINIPVESIDTHNDQRDRHLKSADFFNAREFPNITFKGTELTRGEDDTYTLKGELTMHGQTRPVEAKVSRIEAKETQQGNRLGVTAEMTVKRSEWGIEFMVGEGLGDEVKLMIGVQSVQQ